MEIRCCLLVVVLVCEFLSVCSQLPVYQQQPIPNPFSQGMMYPNRPEDEECRPIKLRLRRTSARFTATVIRNTNPDINYANEDARLMTSRMKSRLDTLARWYRTTYNTQLRVLISYVDGNVPGYDSSIRQNSLHFEGRSARIRGRFSSHLRQIARQAVLAGLDWVFYADQNYCVVSVIPDVCQTNLDLLFLLDESGSVGSTNHRLGLDFMQAVVNFYDIEANRTRVGVVSFSTGARREFWLGDHLTNQAVDTAIGSLVYRGGWTHTAIALYLARLAFLDHNLHISGARPVSAGIPRVVVLITDGRSNHYYLNPHAANLKAAGVTVYSVGIGNYDINELTYISSDPDEDHVFLLRSYTDAASFVQLLSGTTCDTPANIPPGNDTDTDVDEDDFKYFQIQCPAFSDVVIVEQVDIVGHCAVYASTTVVNPGPTNPVAVTVRDENPSANRRRVIIRISITRIVYVSIRGITPMRNRFRMVVWNMLFAQDIYSVTVQNGVFTQNTAIHDLNIINNANDADYFFNITEGNEAGRFSIDSRTGRIFLEEALNAEEQDFYNLTVVAYLRSNDCQRGRVYVEVYVSAANLNPPIFAATNPVDVLETVAVSASVVQVTATDADFGINGEVRYSITGGNPGNEFTINPTTGEISVAAALNHTIRSSYDLRLTATDQASSNPMSATITQRVNVLDVNQRPFFRTPCAIRGACSFSFAEDTATNTILETIAAGDPDTSNNAQLDFTFNPSTTPFAVSSNGQISLRNSVDRETVSRYMFNLTVSDRGSPSLGIGTVITFVITDVNDNPPDLTLPSQVSISENAFVGDGVLQASATDADIGSNARISYTLITGSPLFTIDVSTGAVTLAQTLDYETDTQHSVVVSASNPDGLSSPHRTATVLVINENDNAPVFTLSTYTASVAEGSTTGTPVVTVLANDQDSGVLGDVTYSITSGNSNNNFAIGLTSGMITVSGDIDREVVGEYRLTVRARDGGNPARSDMSTVIITVLDVNDNSPAFQRSSYSIGVREDASVPLELLTLLATDADSISVITYSIESGNVGSVFSLSGTSGTFSLVRSLDFETLQSYSLTVVATDDGSLTGRATVTVTVIDVNDEVPILSGDQTVTLSEDHTTPSEVATFTASGEIGEQLRFRLSGNQNGEFTVDTTSGIVSLVQSLDYEIRQEYQLTVTVTDGAFSTSSMLTIIVTDVNDNAPVITPAGPFTVNENVPINTFVGAVRASDIDSGSNGELSFQIVPSSMLFTLAPNGNTVAEIRTSAELDREALVEMNQFLPPGSQTTITVVVTDMGDPTMSSQVELGIKLLDVNDNAPRFVDPVQEVNISESASIGTRVAQLAAVDSDLGVNARITFSLSGSSLFTIDSSTGTITLAGSLDYETATQHSVVVTASDGVSNTEHTITIRVLDENDNSPIFTLDPYTASVAENSGDGTPVVTVQANDADSGTLGEVVYSIISGNIGEVFSINANNGDITVSGNIDREVLDEYMLVIAASNPGTSTRTTQARVNIMVTDINDNPPLFLQSQYSLSIREDASLSSILTLVVTDADEPGTANSQFDIAITSGNEDDLFRISSPNGVLSLASSLDFEMQTSYTLNVRAVDRGNPSMSSTTVVSISVINVNDEAPQISGDQTVSLRESASVRSTVAQFTSTSEQGESLVFTIAPNNIVSINAETGLVTLAANLDYETQQTFMAQVSVTDGLFSTSATLTVNVVDENDNVPQITSAGPFTVAEQTSEGTLVGTIIANDVDSVSTVLSFFFIGTDVMNYFSINSSNGEIRTAAILDREALESVFPPPGSSQTYRVSVSDGVLSSFADVSITLLDINDNTPIFNGLLTEYDVLENSAMGVEVFVATATDDDLGSNAIVSYSISTSPFAIDTSTGSVTVAGVLDYEMATEHSVTITASDGTLSSSQDVTIRVVDVNDNAPVFSQDTYTAMVVEHSSVNTVVSNATATDADSGTNGIITYSLENANNFISINPSSGEIVVIGDIDRETITQFTFTVVATDGASSAQRDTAIVIVSVTDINDNAPTFQQSSYTVRVREDAATSTEVLTVLATDNDGPGPNSQIDYSFQSDTTVFSISASGIITLEAPLDFETTPSYSLQAVATDRGDPMMSGVTNIIISVTDVNDQPPEFSGDQSIELSELTAVLDQIARFTATGEMGETLTYTLSGTQNGEFEIGVTTGIVTLVSSLDYETTQFYALTVTASDNLFTTSSAFNVTVIDENDNSPQFNPIDMLAIAEEQPTGTPVGQVTATDADSGVNAEIVYSFVQSSTQTYFTIDASTGEITTASTLDRELLVQENLFLPPASQIIFQVQATDRGSPPLFSQIDVTVRLNDINDNPPQFINPPASVSVSESEASGFVVATLTADDADIGQNAIISFSLTGSSLFSINSTSGVVTLVGSLDYETTTEYTVTVTASDGVSSTQHMLTIRVLDENDNSPIFTVDPYTASVAEHSNTSTAVVTVLANDQDSGLFGQVRYSFVNNSISSVFTLNAASGLISVSGDIDRESETAYTFDVRASDSDSTTPLTTTTTVVITIGDINDNAPVFDQAVYMVPVREDTDVPTTLLTVDATDADQPATPNSQVSLSLIDGFGVFELSDSGVFSVTGSLDFETRSSYTIQVTATDNGQPSLTGRAEIIVTVTNVNDQPPEISTDQTIELSELTTANSRVTQFSATGEEGETLEFSLVGDGADIVFDIDSTTGVVTLLTTLDYETTSSYGYSVSVSDGTFSSSSMLSITVVDENDNTPQFVSGNMIEFNEDLPANTVIGRVTAEDADSGVNAELSYSFVQARASMFFTINSTTGEISTAGILDREQLVAMNVFLPPDSQILFEVQASDSGNPVLFSTMMVIFQITDLNDNPPQFINPPASVSMSESEVSGFVVATLSADDADIGQNAIISFSLTGSSLFSINSTSGVVTLVGSLDYETTTEYTVVVTASDGVSSTQHTLTIGVLDENDNSPIFTMDPYTASVAEHSNTSTSVVTVEANDADSGVLGEVTYSITNGNTGDVFTIDSMTGLVSVNNDIDRETTDSYTLVVSAIDGGGRSTDATVTITITDINDNVPVFDPSSYSINVHENTSVNSTLVTVTATDDDIGVNGEISYTIASGNDENLFSISATGAISLISSLDFETSPSHTLFVQAADSGELSLIEVTMVTISVIDINDEVPDLSGDQTVAISEYTTVNSRIAEFTVSNIEQSDVITFELSGTQAEDFEINPSNGVITLAQSLDHEVRPSYDLTVSVGDGVFTSSAQLTVTVLDENDNTPQFQGTGPFTINEEMPANTSVGQVMATDGDSGLNGEIAFSIIRNVGDLFAIDTSSGVITTTAVLDRETLADMNLFVPPGSQQLLTIQAEDSGSPSLFTQVDVTVMLADINDNAPQFGDVPSTISFPENIPVNAFILDASATDADIGPNEEITYSISSSMSPLPFTIDPSTGAVSTNATLDREQVDNYIFSIVATDNGASVQMSSSVTVNLTVTDINDNAPVFRGEPYEESIPEDASTDGGGSIPLVTVFATDSDIGSNSIVTYSLAPDTNSRFRIRNSTGELSVSGGINFEEQTEFNVTVIARDMGLPSLSSSTIVRIRIINVDEFAPDFIGSCDVTIPEDRNVSRDSNPVTQCIAVDQDSGDVFYDIVIEGNNPALSTFYLDQNTGEVFLVQSLDREMLDQYQFTLRASSAGGPQATQMLVTINIGDVNDNAPVFDPSQHTITYNDPQSQNIVTLAASDADINENGNFSAEITSITRTSNSTHEIVITAVDMGTPSMSGSATVIVNNAFPCELMEFSLNPGSLQLSVATLCSLSNPPVSQDYILGDPVSLDCSAVSNLPVTYQWQRDGSFITNPSSNPVLDLGEIGFDDDGSYSCIARNDVGTIQSDAAFISVITLPIIVRPPEDTAVELDRLVVLNCVSTGIPEPIVTFFHSSSEVQLDNRITQNGQFLIITRAEITDSGEYFCQAVNSAGTAQSSPATLVVFNSNELVTTTVLVDNPNDGRTCHNLDVEMIEDLLEETTNHGAEVVEAEADGFCDSGPCYPSPCVNDGRCMKNDNASNGYECTCPDTFTGKNCDADIDECSVEAPCIVGNCTNTLGGFQCTCPTGRRGHRCQYDVRCDNDSLCTEGQCVETLINMEGYICDSTPDNMAVNINLMAGVTADQLEETVYDLTNTLLQLAGTGSSDVCEPRFIPLTDSSSQTYKLIWACPGNTTPPAQEAEELICSRLFTNNIITRCVYSTGEDATPTLVQTLDPIEVTVTFIMLDPVTSTPLQASQALMVLGQGQTLAALQDAGFEASQFQADTVPTDGGNNNGGSSSGGLGGGAVAGIVITLLIVGALATFGAIVALYYGRAYYKKHATYGINEPKTAATLQRNIESGRDRTQTVVGEFMNPTFRRSVMMETTLEDSKDLVFANPTNTDAPKITKLDGNTEVVGKGAINRIYSPTSPKQSVASVTDE